MATNYVQDGKVIETPVAAAVSSGDPVVVGSLFGAYLNDYTSGETAQVAVDGVWQMNKSTSQAVVPGDELYWFSTAAVLQTNATGAALRAGVCWATAASAATTCHVKLNAPNNGAVKAL